MHFIPTPFKMAASKFWAPWHETDPHYNHAADIIAGKALDDDALVSHIFGADWKDISVIYSDISRRLLDDSRTGGMYVPDLMLLVKAQLAPHKPKRQRIC